jgi:DnaJ-class molecular chaperone
MAHIMCWACNGNGRDTRGDYCYQCNGTGCDEKKTRETKTMLESEKTYPKSLPMEPHEKYDIAKFIF